MSSHRILLAALATTALASPAVAQSWRPAPPPDAGRPVYRPAHWPPHWRGFTRRP